MRKVAVSIKCVKNGYVVDVDNGTSYNQYVYTDIIRLLYDLVDSIGGIYKVGSLDELKGKIGSAIVGEKEYYTRD